MRLSDWLEGGPRPTARYFASTRDGWRIALHRYAAPPESHGTPVLLCHGMGSNRFNLDGPGRTSLARHLHARGFDVWLVELRGAGESRRGLALPPIAWRWTFEDYVQHDAPAALDLVRRRTGRDKVLWVGHSLGGMVAYALLMTPAADRVAGAVTLASPGMSHVGRGAFERWTPLRSLLRFAPERIPTGRLARLGAPLAGPLAKLLEAPLTEWGFRPENRELDVIRFMMRRGVEDLSRSLLAEFARWTEARRMSDRYDLFSFTDHLERVKVPMLVVAGARDGLTPPEDLSAVFDRLGSSDKTFVLAGRAGGFSHDYGHVDLVLSRNAAREVHPVVGDWLEKRALAAAPSGRAGS